MSAQAPKVANPGQTRKFAPTFLRYLFKDLKSAPHSCRRLLMKGDFSRLTFDPKKHYRHVLMQQGRVQLDADWNEQQAIYRRRDELEGADVIGPSGAPKTSPGFRISPQGSNLRIGKGHFYVDAILCENENDLLFTEQPDLRPITESLLPTTPGLYVAYLEAWDRHITVHEDEGIRETALGGPDTATRVKT